MKMYVPPAIWSDVHWAPAGPLTVKTRPDCDARSVPGAGLPPACETGPVLTMLTACVPSTRDGSTEASFLSCVPPTIRYAATPATAASSAMPAPTSLGAQDPRDRERALRFPAIPERLPLPGRFCQWVVRKVTVRHSNGDRR